MSGDYTESNSMTCIDSAVTGTITTVQGEPLTTGTLGFSTPEQIGPSTLPR
jgi:hypothetical protein